MRNLGYILICFLMLSNLASAVMACCMDLAPEQDLSSVMQAEDMPCHSKTPDNDQSIDESNQQHCGECESCLHLSSIFNEYNNSSVAPLSSSRHQVIDNFTSLDPAPIYYPPKS